MDNNLTLSLVTVILTSITALASIIVPLISTYINNKHQLKLKNMEFIELDKIDAIKSFVDIAYKYTENFDEKYQQSFYLSFNNLLLYMDEHSYKLLYELHDAASSYKRKDCSKALTPLIKDLSKYIANSEFKKQ